MLPEEQGLIDVAMVWEPFGGPPSEELLVKFGISPRVFHDRVRQILKARGTRNDEPSRQHARHVLRRYLDDDHASMPVREHRARSASTDTLSRLDGAATSAPSRPRHHGINS